MPRSTMLSLLSAAAIPAIAAQCSKAWANCSETMCCETPYFKCVEKNPAKMHNGEFLPAYAQCRNANGTRNGCPCDKPPCIDYSHDYNLKVKLPWSCQELTGGCSPAFKSCGPGKNLDADAKKNWKGVPCCQWGCTCNYSMDWAAQCQPPEGMYGCTKEAQKKTEQKHTNPFAISGLDEVPERAPHAGPVPWFAAGAGAILLVSAAAMVLRKQRRSQGASEADALVDAEADVDSS